MSHDLERYYEHELAFLQDFAGPFAAQYPEDGGRLVRDKRLATDPHAERFLEGFALLAARIHHKIDSELPELTEALLGVVYPHLLAPVPSMAIAQFAYEDPPPPAAGLRVPAHTALQGHPVGPPPPPPRVPCRWRTGYPVELWPLRLAEARWLGPPLPPALNAPPRTQAALVLDFECLGGAEVRGLPLDTLRLHLSGERQMIASLHELLFNHATQIVFRAPGGGRGARVELPAPACLAPVGLGLDEGLLPWPAESFVGYRLLRELLSFRDKFLFIDLGGWRAAGDAGLGRAAEVLVFFDRTQPNVEQGVNARTFLPGCTPVVNLFEQSAEPVPVTQTQVEQRVVPTRAAPLAAEVYSVDAVTLVDPRRGAVPVQPFYSFTYDQSRDNAGAFWYARRAVSRVEGDRGTEVNLVLVDRGFDARLPAEAILDVRATCTDRDRAARYHRAGDELRVRRGGPEVPWPARLLQQPTAPLRPPLRRAAHWRLLAQLALNQAPLSDAADGRAALQDALRVRDFADPEQAQQLAAVNRQMVEGILGLRSRLMVASASGGGKIGLCRGVEFTLELDEQKYVGSGALLFASVLERYLGLAAAVNSFSRLAVRTRQAEGFLKKWPPRAAERQLR